jgi:glycine/D-amino acid oxidase-like deaminating enzyme
MPARCDVVIVGAGIAGVSVTAALATAGVLAALSAAPSVAAAANTQQHGLGQG